MGNDSEESEDNELEDEFDESELIVKILEF